MAEEDIFRDEGEECRSIKVIFGVTAGSVRSGVAEIDIQSQPFMDNRLFAGHLCQLADAAVVPSLDECNGHS